MYHDLYIGGKALVERENVGFDLTKSELCPSFIKDLTTKGVVLRVVDSHTGNHHEDNFMPLETIRRGLGYARVLVEVNAEKKLVDQIEVLYKDRGSNEQFVKKIKVKYDWKPPICSLCKVFGHMDNNCAKMEKKEGNMKENNKQEEVIPRKYKEDNTNQEEYTTPTKAQKKIWNVDASVIKEVRNSANKFAVLQEVDDENCIVHLSKQEKEEIGKYVMMKIQPSFSATSKWTSEMKEYYKVAWENQHNKDMNNGNKDSDGDTDIEFNENDVYVDRSGIAKFMSENEVDGVGRRDRKELWKDLNLNKRVAGNDPWVIMGDVNVSLHLDDHSEGMSNYTQDMIDLQDCVNYIEVEDINWSGLHFTWTKSLLNPDNTILKKIDRIMGNNPFLAQYSNASALFLPYGISDHSLAIYKIAQAMKKKNKSFRLANNITDKAKFYDLIDMDPTNKDLRSSGVEILRAYKEAVIDKEKLLRQNTKVTWLSEGDKNSALNCDVEEQFADTLLIDIDDDKDPRPDGFTSKFFRKSWGIIKKEFCALIKEFFTSGKLLGEVNATLISLIPKSLTPQKVSDYRHIACCNVVYKCISKILTNRIKKAFSYIVDENQHAFVPGRAITNNILLTQELLKGYNCINGLKRFSFKIDIQKAYDTVDWKFIEDILRNFGFPDKLIGWIMTCLTTNKFIICVNGERFRYFRGGRGLRQGDPISPYIFTMVIEMLNLLVKEEIKKEKAFKYHFGCKQLKITHMCFENDLIMICHGDIVSVKTLKRALDKFSAISGLCPNLGKCTMFCRSLDNTVKNAISDIFPFKEGKLPVKYLGVPLVTKKIRVADYKQLIDKGLVFLLPKSIINDIERLFKRFLWNSGESYKGKVKVAWCDVCKLKDQGSLGFKSLETWSLGWKCLLSFRNWIGSHMRFRVGNGMSINAWHDKWDSRVALSSMISKKEIFYAGFKDQDKLMDIIDDNGWKWPQE
ncbi:RNA-directed DNA polymerase, eukaryota, reverse transcriptase zinc-binding domain protein [Tanacetum coccineum]